MRYFIKISYNGRNYKGWQVQGNSPTVQRALNNALSTIFKEDIHTTGAGRTDTGVHAEEFYAHFDLPHPNPLQMEREKKALVTNERQHGFYAHFDLPHPNPLQMEREKKALVTNERQHGRQELIYKLNGILPYDIAVHDIFTVREDAHARFSALSRTYKYYICRRKDPFHNELAYYLYGNLNVKLMNKAAKLLKEYTDFTSFSKLHTNTKTNNCKVISAHWEYVHSPQSTVHNKALVTNERQQWLVFTIKADRFLRNMVRAIVGTLIEVGRGKIDIKEFNRIIESKNRSDAGYSVPAHGLFLTNIEYPSDLSDL